MVDRIEATASDRTAYERALDLIDELREAGTLQAMGYEELIEIVEARVGLRMDMVQVAQLAMAAEARRMRTTEAPCSR